MGKSQKGSWSFLHKYFWHLIIVIIVIGGLANVLVWSGSRRRSQATALELPSYPVETVAWGRELYRATCATCHGQGGEGYARADSPAPALDGSMHAWHHPDSQIANIVRNGFGQMPAVGANWTDNEVNAVLAYIKQWWEPEQLAYQTEASQQNP